MQVKGSLSLKNLHNCVELTSAGLLLQWWFPHLPVYVAIIIFGTLLFGLNVFSVKGFGETEFWFAGIKVIVILLFILIGLGAMFGIVPMKGAQAPGLSHFFDHGLFPNGALPVLLTMIAVNFSYQGTELVGIATGESMNPHQTIPRAINNVIWRTLLFFVMAILVLSALIPWQQAGVSESPFVRVMSEIGIPYAASRMLWAMSGDGMAMSWLHRVNRRGAPLNALMLNLPMAKVREF
ncbi:amino acid permease [Alicyclobacillaceae bacterium I2511]|nr:amino acid permease [Alicyclobacillaceae bacterium I2511]